MLKDQQSSKDRSSGYHGVVKSGAQGTGTLNGNHNRGQSTDDSSVPKPASKSYSESGSAAEIAPPQYVKVKLTKDVLHAFEEQTRTSPFTLIQMYLERCEREKGEIDDLLTPDCDDDSSSSGETSSSPDDDEEEDDEEEEEEDELVGASELLNLGNVDLSAADG